MFTPQALWTAARYQVPVTAIVLNNRGYRAMRRSVMRSCPEATRKGYDFSFEFHVDLMQLAGSFGVEATSVSAPSSVAEVVEAAMKSNRPTLVEVQISPSASVII